jgi:hypothetical protein
MSVHVCTTTVFSVKGSVLAGLCLVSLTSPLDAAPGFAPEATSSLSPPPLAEQFDAESGQFAESANGNHGGGIYSPFSTILDASTALPRETSAKPIRNVATEEAPDLMATMLAAGIAAGLLVYLVRVLIRAG